ncbi:Sensor histidine kinase GacS [Paramyrothecium foliicola]|nr:Sensor histidine kinase GacS [Paramyrothecium foliicola]
MGDFASPALNGQSTSDAEKQRIRELLRFYSAVRTQSAPGPAVESAVAVAQHATSPSLSSDITLNALAQLAVLRFGCNRSFISLIDGQNQHIIAETTSSISLRDGSKHGPDDGVYLGVSTLDLAFGVCPHAVKLFTGQPVPVLQNTDNVTANRTRFIVRDFTKEEYFKDRPYVTEWPHFRFYAEVPVYSPAGFVLGSFCIVDNKPRQHFSDDEIAALQEISDSISQHLDNVRTVHFHQRSDRLVHGLKEFVKRRPYFGISASTDSQGVSPSLTALPDLIPRQDSDHISDLGIGRLSISTEPTENPSFSMSELNTADVTDVTSLSRQSQGANLSRPSSGIFTEKRDSKDATDDGSRSEEGSLQSTAPVVAVRETISVARRIALIFAQAGNLLRESMDLDGVLFLDASRCNSGIVRPTDTVQWEPLPKSSDPRFPGGAPPQMPQSNTKDKPCDTLGFASKTHQYQTPDNFSRYKIPESLLKRMVASYPNGESFSLKDALATQDPTDNTLRETEFSLLQIFPEADSVIFLPLWDFDKGQWLAGTFLWSRNPERALGVEELHYFRIFSDSLTSEVARVNWSKQEQSKSQFISSLSHELRSPLHGILASAELLSSTSLESDQENLVKMLETCGHTLLDTMNHLLDFAKINNLTTAKAVDQSLQRASTASLMSAFELDTLVEEVVSTMYLGKLHSASQMDSAVAIESGRPQKSAKSKLSVFLRVDRQTPWKVHSITGAWRRILMNLLGNSLKYTRAGFVEVSLTGVPNPSDPDQLIAHLSVTDSGRGMSSDFLRHKLFSPFSQEDHLSEGVGLGLSIVQQLVDSLQGSIDVRSEPGSGTQVDIFIPVQSVLAQTQPRVETVSEPSSQPTKFCMIGLNAYSDLVEPPTGMLGREAKRRLGIQSLFTDLISANNEWSLSFADKQDTASGDVAIVEQSLFDLELRGEVNSSVDPTRPRRFLVLCDTVLPSALSRETSGNVVYIAQPLCPRKVIDALRQIANIQTLPVTSLPSPPPALTQAAVPPSDERTPSAPTEAPATKDLAPRVLIVDDNLINIKVLSAFVKKLGWAYDTASDGLVALNKYKESPGIYKVVLMDLSMPVMDGIVATTHIRAFEQQSSLLPVTILAITGVGSTAMKQQALSAGVDDYMIKPLSFQQLKLSLDKLPKTEG